ncbi:MAG TPA: hypothetical protein VF677_02530 [Flavobacterium sp.]
MAKGVKKIRYVKGLDFPKMSVPGQRITIAPDQWAWFQISEWESGTTEEDKKKSITWMRQSSDRKIIVKQISTLPTKMYGFKISKKLCGSYHYFIEASLSGKRDFTNNTGLYVKGWSKPMIVSSKWTKQQGSSHSIKNKNKADYISYGHIVYLHLETEGLNGNKLIIELWNQQYAKDDKLVLVYTDVQVIDGEVNLKIQNTYAWMAHVKNIQNVEEFYIKVKDQGSNQYIKDSLGDDLHAIYLNVKNRVATVNTDIPQNQTPTKIGKPDKKIGAPARLNPVLVTIGRVIRGNPYIEKNATAVVGLPDSVPLNKTYEVEVVVKGKGTVNLAIINSSADNGNATVTPSSITATAIVIVKGTAMTKPGHGGQLLIEARVAGVVAANSQPFTVCCHPINYTDTYAGEIDTPLKLGVIVQDGWNSDNSIFTDLKEVEIKEVVDYVGINDSPPFPPRGEPANNSGYLPGDQLTQDRHSIPRAKITLGRAGITEANQLCIYKCKCCGANDIVHPNSGFKRIHEVYNVGTATAPQWKHRTKKKGALVTINTYISNPGNANVTSQEHNLP